jgi:thiamine-phosphate pyrophosphorylase
MPASAARKLIGPNKILGVSAATIEEAKVAEKDGADCIGVGAMFSTSTKQDTRVVSVDLLKELKESISIPVVAIGGINEDNGKQLKLANIDGIAVVSAILGKADIKTAAERMKALMKV